MAFADDDAVTHAGALAGTPVRVASATADPFHPAVLGLARALLRQVEGVFATGFHGSPLFTAQEPPSPAFLAHHVAG